MIKRLLALIYFTFHKLITKNQYKSDIGKWFLLNGNKMYLAKHPLDGSSVVFDVGGYEGIFTDILINKYDPVIYVFEPVKKYYEKLKNKYYHNNKVKILGFGLSDKTEKVQINIKEDESTIFGDSKEKETAQMVDVMGFVEEEGLNKIDLMTINIEGGEYALLNRILSSKLNEKIDFIQVQFHNFVENSESMRSDILKKLDRTHIKTFSFPFIWEGFKKR